MGKIICDICGTVYPDTAENCPICGFSNSFSLEELEADILQEETVGYFAASPRKNKEIFDFDEVNEPKIQEEEPYDDDDDEDYEEEPKTNVFLVIFLVLLIALLLLATGFIFFRFLLPNMMEDHDATLPVVTTAPVETETQAPVETGIPCQSLVLEGGKAELSSAGQPWLINVKIIPEDTTDTLSYLSANENVATVDESGKVIAVGEGETEILITCGTQQIRCPIVVNYSLATEPTAAEETAPAETADATEPATEAATEPAKSTEATVDPNAVKLKLKKNDISLFSVYSSATLILDCELALTDLDWMTMDSSIAIVNEGVVTATGRGTTKIIGTYGDQKVECIVRCNF